MVTEGDSGARVDEGVVKVEVDDVNVASVPVGVFDKGASDEVEVDDFGFESSVVTGRFNGRRVETIEGGHDVWGRDAFD
jgi:hypothetical protein